MCSQIFLSLTLEFALKRKTTKMVNIRGKLMQNDRVAAVPLTTIHFLHIPF